MSGKTQNSKELPQKDGEIALKKRIPQNFVDSVAGQSNYLQLLAKKNAAFCERVLSEGPDAVFAQTMQEVQEFQVRGASKARVMSFLRVKKAEVSFLIAAADISDIWCLRKVTNALSEFADLVILKASEFLLAESYQAKMLGSADVEKSGLLVVAVGKLGGKELNYSSDVDLILLYDAEKADYTGKSNVRQFFIRFANEFVRMLQERTADGYVFRVDLRLRPDPYSTPVAVSVQAAETYYENVGQNWERAAMIKARLVCGDAVAGQSYMRFIDSFVWRKYLDFDAITDIHSIKRQIDSTTGYSPESLLGYNIKLGKGGIREIEFFAQVQQLIWGGRVEEMRQKATCDALVQLEALERIPEGAASELIEIYEFYRDIEHRLQMVDDAHTHSLPTTDEEMQGFCEFLGFPKKAEFEVKLRRSIEVVQAYYAGLFTDSPSLSAEGNLVFTGVSNDPETLVTLAKLGFKEPEKICEVVRGWHHGRRRSTRFKKVREILTELTPDILKYFSRTGDPDVAFVKFDAFLTTLPSGVQLFTLFNERPELIEQVADLMGDSPWLAENFSRSPALVNRILATDFNSDFFTRVKLQKGLLAAIEGIDDYAAVMKVIRRWKHDMEFQIGIKLLKKTVKFREAGLHFSNVAEIAIGVVLQQVQLKIGEEIDGEFAIVAMGKLGSRELTFGSDLDLVFVYDSEAEGAHKYYVKLAQNLTTVMNKLSSDGVLYKVDTRLRPQGSQGSMACSFKIFQGYYQGKAWNWEMLALTKARVVFGGEKLNKKLNQEINSILTYERDLQKFRKDVFDMRAKIAESFSSSNPWDLKYAKGGLFELEFMVQYLVLAHGKKHPDLLDCDIEDFWKLLATKGVVAAHRVQELESAFSFMKLAEGVVRLTTKAGFSPEKASSNQRDLIVEFFDEEKFDYVQEKLIVKQRVVNENFRHMFEV